MENEDTPQTGKPVSHEERWADLLWLPCRLTVDVPVRGLTVGRLLKLQPHSVLSTGQEKSSNVPVLVNGQLIGWGEFEVIGERLAIHLAELV